MIGRQASNRTIRRRWAARHKAAAVMATVVLLGVLAAASLFTVGPNQTAFVLTFGRTVRGPISEPGLYARWPWQRARVFDERIRFLICEPAEKLTADHEPLVIQPAAFWRISTSGTRALLQKGLSEVEMEGILRELIWRHVDQQIAGQELTSWLGGESREGVTARAWKDRIEEITLTCRQEAGKRFAVEIIEVRLLQFNRPASLQQGIFRQMIAEREREADAIRQDAARRSAELVAAASRRGDLFVAAAAQRAGKILHEARVEAAQLASQDEIFSPLSTRPSTTAPATATAAP